MTMTRAAAASRSGLRAFVELAKPRITLMVLFSTAAGYVSSTAGGWWAARLVATLAATGFLSAAAAVLNQWWERDADAQMRRTCGRPIPSGRIRPVTALGFGVALAAMGVLGLFWLASSAAVAGLLTLVTYVLVYTPLKRRSSSCVFAGAFAGAMPPVIGGVAATSQITASVVVLFALMFIWQLPHVYALALVFREDYSAAGVKFLASGRDSKPAQHILGWTFVLFLVSVMPAFFHLVGFAYVAGATIAGLLFMFLSFRLLLNPTRHRARQVLLGSLGYLPAVLTLLVADLRLPAALAFMR